MGKQKKTAPARRYNEEGYYIWERKRNNPALAKNPAAYTLYHHLIGYANFSVHPDSTVTLDGKPIVLRIGELVASPWDLSLRLGWGVNRVYRALRWLERRGYVERRVGYEGTIIYLPKYVEEQGARLIREPDPKWITPPPAMGIQNGSPSGTSPIQNGSPSKGTRDPKRIIQNDPSLLSRSIDQQQQQQWEAIERLETRLCAYFQTLGPKKMLPELTAFSELLGTKRFSERHIADCLDWLRKNKVPGRNGLEDCANPMRYLATNIDQVLPKARKGAVGNGAGYGAGDPIPDEDFEWIELPDGTRALKGVRKREAGLPG